MYGPPTDLTLWEVMCIVDVVLLITGAAGSGLSRPMTPIVSKPRHDRTPTYTTSYFTCCDGPFIQQLHLHYSWKYYISSFATSTLACRWCCDLFLVEFTFTWTSIILLDILGTTRTFGKQERELQPCFRVIELEGMMSEWYFVISCVL